MQETQKDQSQSQTSSAKIQSLSNGPFGITKDASGLKIFIEDTCPEDVVNYEIYDKRKDFAYAKLTEIVEASPHRDPDPKCKLHKICGGCQWQHIEYDYQLHEKRKQLIDAFNKSRINGRNDWDLEVIGMEEPWNYRNKITYPVDTIASTNRLVAGYYKRASHELINVKYCPIQYEIFDAIMEYSKDLFSQKQIGKPFLRHISIRANLKQDQVLVTFIVRRMLLNSQLRRDMEDITESLKHKFKEIKFVCLNFNDDSTNVIFGPDTVTIGGNIDDAFIEDELDDVKFRISATSFFQINNKQFRKILTTIREYSKDINPRKILDAYCGIGTISLSLAKSFPEAQIIGIEEVPTAIQNAQENASLNFTNTKRINYLCSRVEDLIEEYPVGEFDLVIINPPRKGCTNKVLDALGQLQSKNIIYVSCNPHTLTRDLKYLEQFGFETQAVSGVDMFPHTYHLESVVKLSLKS